jgi:hypothetical protein
VHPAGTLSAIIGELDPSGHVWGWELEPTEDGGTKVTHTYDWTGVQDQGALALSPRVAVEQMQASIARVGEAAG